MGKPFSKEIEDLEATYSWALKEDILNLANTLRKNLHLPLIVVGSGGSFSAAVLHVSLHRQFFQSISMAVTPIEIISALPRDGVVSVWLLSASGNNIDLRRALKHTALHEPLSLNILVGRTGSKAAELSQKYQHSNIFEYSLPAGKDGFLATNSLLAFSVLLLRSYIQATDKTISFPRSIYELFKLVMPDFNTLMNLKAETSSILQQRTLHVVYSEQLKSLAVDIESKFIEAGLGSVHLADQRNFAHGRHHWFAKNSDSSGILFLTTQSDLELSKKTMQLLPENIEKKIITFSENLGIELIAGILLSIYLTYWRGQFFNIDPGRPGVPDYGSKIYRLSAKAGFISSMSKQEAALKRKIRSLAITPSLDAWTKSYDNFTRRLASQNFAALILDYDGTLVDSRSRDNPPCQDICNELNRILEAGIKVGFATGRGKSIRYALQKPGVIDQKHWGNVIIGYYNGAEVAYLTDNHSPDSSKVLCNSLSKIYDLLDKSLSIRSLKPLIEKRKFQLTLEATIPIPESHLWETVSNLLQSNKLVETEVVRSSHSIDILAKDVCKLTVLEFMISITGENKSFLTIGDRGRWPGNDAKLLSHDYSLSVDEVSSDDNSCWNLCTAGIRGPQGTLEYLKRIKCKDGVFKFS